MVRSKIPTLTAVLVFAVLLSGCGFGYSSVLENIANKRAVSGQEFTDVLETCEDCDRFRDLFVADLHADSFLWGRDVLEYSNHGHVDMERLRQAGVDLQVFGVPSMTPYGVRGFDTGLNGADTRYYDPNVTARDIGGLRCTSAAKNIDTARLLYGQTGRMVSSARDIAYEQARRFCIATDGHWDTGSCTYSENRKPTADKMFAVRTRADLKALERAIARSKVDGTDQPIGAMLAVEGVHWIKAGASDADIKTEITNLKNAGFRIIGLVHKFSNNLASSDEDCAQTYGLTSTGLQALREIYAQGLILDMAHLSADSIVSTNDSHESVLSFASISEFKQRRWMIMSHGAIRTKTCQNYRNLPQEHVARMLEAGIIFGVIHWDLAYCLDLDKQRGWRSADRIEQAIVDTYWRAVTQLGVAPDKAIASLAIGADLDGGVNAPYDVRGFPLLLKRMSEALWCADKKDCSEAIARIAGENFLEFLESALPEQ